MGGDTACATSLRVVFRVGEKAVSVNVPRRRIGGGGGEGEEEEEGGPAGGLAPPRRRQAAAGGGDTDAGRRPVVFRNSDAYELAGVGDSPGRDDESALGLTSGASGAVVGPGLATLVTLLSLCVCLSHGRACHNIPN